RPGAGFSGVSSFSTRRMGEETPARTGEAALGRALTYLRVGPDCPASPAKFSYFIKGLPHPVRPTCFGKCAPAARASIVVLISFTTAPSYGAGPLASLAIRIS